VREVIKLSGFILLAIGTIGLIVTEILIHWGGAAVWQYSTLTFGAVNALGLAALAFVRWGMQKDA